MSENNSSIKISLLVSTYNWPEALKICLKTVEKQSVRPFEVLIADDGSGPMTREVVEAFQRKSSLNIRYIWHEDEGFRLAKIRNKALAAALGDYIVQIDGDIILHRHFIKDHQLFAKKGTFVRASRIYINEAVSKKMIEKEITTINAFSKGISNFFSAIRIPFGQSFFEYTYKTKGLERFEIHGCNMAYWRADAIAVNGYNEDFEGWGPEDKEFITRLLNNGNTRRFLKMGGIAFHLYHQESSRALLDKNQKMLDVAIQNKKVFCETGVNQYL